MQKLLVVDDDQQIREIISHFLTIQGYHVAQADNGTQALKKCFEENFDVVVTDFQMPGMNGLSLTHRIHSVVPETPVIVMSGDGSIGKNKALNVGCRRLHSEAFCHPRVVGKDQNGSHYRNLDLLTTQPVFHDAAILLKASEEEDLVKAS